MARKRGNPTWPQGGGFKVIPPGTPTAFEEVVEELGLQEYEYQISRPLRLWVKANRNKKYVPEYLLHAWGFEVKDSLTDLRRGDA